MRIVCIIGAKGTNKKDVAEKLTQFGYYKTISYTTRKQRDTEVNGKDYYFVTKDKFKSLIDKGIVMEWQVIDEEYYGSPHPIGTENNVVVTENNGLESIREVYEEQVIGVYIKKDTNDFNEKCEINIEPDCGVLEAVQKILMYIHSKED